MLDDADARLAVAAGRGRAGQAERRVRDYFANDRGAGGAGHGARRRPGPGAARRSPRPRPIVQRAQVDLQRRQALAASGAVSGEELTARADGASPPPRPPWPRRGRGRPGAGHGAAAAGGRQRQRQCGADPRRDAWRATRRSPPPAPARPGAARPRPHRHPRADRRRRRQAPGPGRPARRSRRAADDASCRSARPMSTPTSRKCQLQQGADRPAGRADVRPLRRRA